MKLLKRVSILAVLITVIAVFAGCGKEATVVGTWEGDDYTYTFNDDGTGIQQIGEISVSITSYEAKDGKLSITISFLGTEETDEYTYSIKKNKQVDASDFGYLFFVVGAFCFQVFGISIQDMYIFFLYINMVKKVFPHKCMVAFWMIFRQAYIFVHIESNDILERYFSLLVQFYQRFVHA